MPKKDSKGDPVEQKLDAILGVMQDLLILESARAGIRRDDIRKIVPVDSNRISRIMRHVKKPISPTDD